MTHVSYSQKAADPYDFTHGYSEEAREKDEKNHKDCKDFILEGFEIWSNKCEGGTFRSCLKNSMKLMQRN